MKKINSIGYGHRFLWAIGVLGAALPLALWGLYRLAGLAWARVATFVCLGLGAAVLVVFLGLLAVEFAQDAAIDRHYQSRVRRAKLQTPGGAWECQACGYGGLGERDTACPVCGCGFHG